MRGVQIMKPTARGFLSGLMFLTLLLALIAIRDRFESFNAPDFAAKSTIRGVSRDVPGNVSSTVSYSDSPPSIKEAAITCLDEPLRTYHWQTGQYHIVYNYIKASKVFCHNESITYTTHADHTFLDNLEVLSQRWKGPISVSIYAPGDDFSAALQSIHYVRECYSYVKDFVSFHLIFTEHHQPRLKNIIMDREKLLHRLGSPNCSVEFPWSNDRTYRKSRRLMYPINVARNAARLASSTYFVLPSDIELYPSENVIPGFLELIRLHPELLDRNPPKVFVFPIFEVKENAKTPENKTELVRMLKNKDGILFHEYVCASCHRVPQLKAWLNANITDKLEVLHVAKRWRPYNSWEPIYIGTNKEPPYDERLSWEGMSDKMTQMYILCLQDYEFHILNNVFLVHKPGIKKSTLNKERRKITFQQRRFIDQIVAHELEVIYGTNKNCTL